MSGAFTLSGTEITEIKMQEGFIIPPAFILGYFDAFSFSAASVTSIALVVIVSSKARVET